MIQAFTRLFRAQGGVYQSWHGVGLLVGIVSTFAYAFFALQSTVLEMWSHNLMVLALLVALFKAPGPARSETIFRLFGAMFLLSLFSYAHTHLAIPEYAEERVYFHKLSAVFGFVLIAWWLGGDTRRVFVMLGLALAGFFVALFIHGHDYHIKWALWGRRVSFGFHNAQHTAMFFSVALIGWTVFSARFLRAKGVPALRYAVWALILVVLVAGVIITQTRAAWLGLGVAAVTAGGIWLLKGRGGGAVRVSTVLLTIVIASVVVGALVGRFAKPLEKRLNSESGVIAQVVRGEFDNLPDTDIGVRIKLWREAVSWIRERPMTGWGYEIRSRFIGDSRTFPEALKGYGHMHNSYLEIVLIYGLVGVAVFATLIAYVTTRVWKSWRRGEIPDDVALFGFSFFAFWVVANLFESYIFGKTGTYLVAVVLGSVYTFPLARCLRMEQAAQPDGRQQVQAAGG